MRLVQLRVISADEGPPGGDEFAHSLRTRNHRLQLAAVILEYCGREHPSLAMRFEGLPQSDAYPLTRFAGTLQCLKGP